MHLALSSPPQSLPLLLSFLTTKKLQAYNFTEDFICKRGVPKTQVCSVSVDVFIDSEHPGIFEDYIIILIMLLKYNQFKLPLLLHSFTGITLSPP
jgi:hypothetical protein